MTFAYQAGSATPDYSGLIEFPNRSLRIGNLPDGSGNLPSFRPLVIPPISETCPIRFSTKAIPRGSFVSKGTPDTWQFDVDGWFLLDEVDDVQAAVDYLKAAVNIDMGRETIYLNALGWSEKRTMVVRKAGPVIVAPPEQGQMVAPRREFTLTLIADDPRKYSYTEHDTTIGSGTSVTNAGDAAVGFVVRFEGANTSYIAVDGPVGDGSDRVRIDYALAGGEWLEYDTATGDVTTNSAADYGDIAAATLRTLRPGTTAFTKSSGSGGTAHILHHDGWE